MHNFTLNGKEDPVISGLEGLLDEYRSAVAQTTLWGPTFFSLVLERVLAHMEKHVSSPMYNILLFLTDGNIHDLRETVDAMVKCSNFPISVIIVGIGDGDFSSMEFLDGDNCDTPLTDGTGQESKRDICQFVRLNDFKDEDGTNADLLAEAVLEEVPDQLVGYMQEIGEKPGDA